MSTTENCISQCPDCAAESSADTSTSGDTAVCIECGTLFFLPQRARLQEEFCPEISTPADQDGDFVLSTLWRRARIPGIATTTSLLMNGVFLFVLGLFWFYEDATQDPLTFDLGTVERQTDFEVTPEFAGGDDAPADAVFEMTQSSIVLTDHVTPSEMGKFSIPSGVSGLAGGSSSGGFGGGSGIFTGMTAAGSFAYVVDASGSMEGARMRLVLSELTRSIQGLKETQEFFVVFFSDKTFSMMWPKVEKRLVPADGINRNRVLQWAYNVSPDGGTDPQGALKQALELEPDVVFFLTDGDIPDTTRRTVKRHRKGTTVVNTICVGSHAATELMKEIAINSGGQFVAVR